MAVTCSTTQFALELIIAMIRNKDISMISPDQKEHLRAYILDARKQLDELYSQCEPIEVIDVSVTRQS